MHSSFWKSFVRTWNHHFIMQLATLAVLAGTYTVVTLAFLGQQNLTNILSVWGQSVQVSAYLSEGVAEDKVPTLKGKIESIEGIKKLSFVSKDEAVRRFSDQMSTYAPEFMSDLKFGNPLPASFEIELNEEVATSGSAIGIKAIADQISKFVGIDDVTYGQGWVENYSSLVSAFSNTGWVIILILLAGSLFVVGNSIRSSINSRRDEIEILELFGATTQMIRGPYIFEGAAMGFLASLTSVALCYLLFSWQTDLFEQNLGFLGLGRAITYLSAWQVFIALFLGTAFGAIGSMICVNSISSGWAAAEAQNNWSEKI